MASNSSPPPRPETTHKVQMPEGNERAIQKAAAPLATASSHADPWPHYIMAGACGGSAYHAYSKMKNPRAAGVGLALGAAYLWAGRLLADGNARLGYDLGSITSLALTAAVGPTAWATGEAAATVMASLGGISSVTNVIKSYQQRTGKPHEIGYTRE